MGSRATSPRPESVSARRSRRTPRKPVASRTAASKSRSMRARNCRNKRGARRPDADGGRMPLINLVITLIVVGVLLWLVNTYIPMDGKIKKILNIVVVVVVVIWLLGVFGVLDHLRNVRASLQLPFPTTATCSLVFQPGMAATLGSRC